MIRRLWCRVVHHVPAPQGSFFGRCVGKGRAHRAIVVSDNDATTEPRPFGSIRARGPFCAAAILLALILWPAPADAATQLHWAHRAHRYPSLTIVNLASRAWPARAAAGRWHVGFRFGRTGNITVRSEDDGPDDRIIGSTYWYGHGSTITRVVVAMNDWYDRASRAVRVQAITHELGHALGLPHDTSGGVMSPTDLGGAYITHFERVELAELYGVKR